MEWKDVSDALKKYAPEAEALLGVASLIPGVGIITGPAEIAITAISKALGTDATPDAIVQAIATDPNAALKMKQAELDYQLQMKDKELAAKKEENGLLKAGMADTQDARKMHMEETKVTGKRDNEDKVFDWIVMLGFYVVLAAVLYFKPAESTILGGLMGTAGAGYLQVLNFRKGSTVSGNEKTAMIYNSTPNVSKAGL